MRLSSRGVLAAVAAGALLLFVYAAAVHPGRPGAQTAVGWYGGFDQGQYIAEARALSRADLPASPSDYTYPLAYPALGAVAIRLGFDGDPFTPVNALAFAAAMALVASVGSRLVAPWFGAAAAAAIALATPLLDLTVMPWTSTITVVAVLAALVAMLAGPPYGWGAGLVVGIAVGFAFAARLVDGVFVALVAAVPVIVSLRQSWRAVVAASAAALAIAALVFASHVAVFGDPFTTPYASHLGLDDDISDQSAKAYDLAKVPRSFVEMFVTARYQGVRQDAEPIGRLFPWAALSPVGVVLLWRRRHEHRVVMTAAAAASVVATVFYLSFRYSRGDALPYGAAHYFKAWFPVWGLLGLYGIYALIPQTTRPPRG